jgi:hypothetical protein
VDACSSESWEPSGGGANITSAREAGLLAAGDRQDQCRRSGPETVAPAPWIGAKRGEIAVGGTLFALAVVLPLLRQTGVRSWQTIWREDGPIYVTQASQHGGLAVLLRGYHGYLQLPSRILGAVSTVVPVQHLAVYLAVSAAVVGALLGWFCYQSSAGWVRSRPARLVLASLIVLMPALGGENTANITNIIWVFAAVAPWALISLAERPGAVMSRSIVAFLAATSTVLCVLFLPLALGYGLIRKSRATWIVAAAFCVGLALQALVVFHTTNVEKFSHPSIGLLARLTGGRVFGTFLIGNRAVGTMVPEHQGLVIVGSTLCVAIIFVVLLPGAGRRSQLLAAVLVAYAVMMYVAPIWERGISASAAGARDPWLLIFYLNASQGLRYSVIPVMLLASAVAVLVAPQGPGRARRTAAIGRPIFVIYISVLTLVGFSVTNPRSAGPSWSASAGRTYRTRCEGANSDKLVDVPTARTLLSTRTWPVTVRCRDLRWSRSQGSPSLGQRG